MKRRKGSVLNQIQRKIKEASLAAFAAGGLSVFCEIRRELQQFWVCRYQIRVEDPRPEAEEETEVRLVFLSDLHGKVYGEHNQKLIRAVEHEKPDLILAGGDLLTRSDPQSDAAALALLEELTRLGPVYLGNGNHEQKLRLYTEEYGDRYAEYMSRVRAAGVQVLENDSAERTVRGVPFRISGLELPIRCYGRGRIRKLRRQEVQEAVGAAKPSCYQILLAHTPVYLPVYWDWGADLTLSGHLHGGIIRLPGTEGMITPQARLFPKYAGGIYREGRHIGIVSRGLGTHTVNLRFGNPAELVSVTVKFCPCAKPVNQV